VIQRLTGIRHHPAHVWALLRHRLGWTVQRPKWRATERHQAAIAAATGPGACIWSRWVAPAMSASWQVGNQAWSSWRLSTNRRLLWLPRTERTGQVMAAACSDPKVHFGPGSSVSKKVAASFTACAIHSEVVEEPDSVLGLHGNAGRPRVNRAGAPSDWAVQMWAPSMVGDEPFTEWLAKYARQSVSRGAILTLLSAFYAYDLVDVFPAVRVPTLVLHRRDDGLVPVRHGRQIASQIPDARFVELEGVDHLPFVGDAEAVLAEVQDFLIGSRTPIPRQRRLLTLVFTNIADSTPKAVDLGDDAWRELLAAHDRDVGTHLTRFGGEEVKHLANGVLAVFDGPARAIRCALGIVEASEPKGLSVRVGVHTGECEMVDADVRGIAVHVGARILELAAPGQILVSSTVHDLVAGSGIRFGEGRDVELAGMPGTPRVFSFLRHGASPEAVRRSAVEQANLFRRDGEYWTVGYRGLVITLRDTKGLRDLGRLLAQPGREYHVLDLMADGTGAQSIPPSQAADAGLAIEGWGQPVIDQAARAHYKRRITELEQEIEEAQERGGGEASAAAREELDALITELAAAYGLAGRPRRSPDPVERARKAVSHRLRNALSRIDRAHPRLGRHLAASIRTGEFCSYQPERDIIWSVHANTG
jgi:class 3 adenylate cyclase